MATDPGAPTGAGADDGRVRRRYGSILSRRPLPIRFHLGDSPPGIVGRVFHWWRYGSFHPDEDLLGVLDAAVDSLTAQIKSAEGFLTGSRRQRLDAIRTELNTELADEVPELAVLLGIEAKINALYPPAVQRQRAWMIQERFKRVAPGQAADYWSAAREDTLLAEAHDDRIRRADEAVAAATAAQMSSQQALATADEALVKAKADHGDASSEAAAAQAARDAAAAANEAADWSVASTGLERDLVHARCELERLQARLRGTERAARERRADPATATALIEGLRGEVGEAQARVDAAAGAVQAHAGTRPDGASAPTAAGGDGEEAAGETPGGASVDAEAQTLLGYIHSAYLMGIARERAVRDLMRWLMMRFWSANITLLLVLFLAWFVLTMFTTGGRYALLLFGLFAIAAIGRVGATMSVVQRLQGAIANNVLAHDPIQELTRLRTGKNGINLALFSGGVFALLTYAFFASGVPALLGFDEGIAPAIGTIQDDQQAQAQQRVASQNLARAARELQDQEQRVRELEAELAAASGADEPTTPAEGETAPEAQPPVAEGAPGPQPDAGRVSEIEAQLVEARAVLEQRRTALAVAAAAAAPPIDAPVANEGADEPEGEADGADNAADGNAGAGRGNNVVSANSQSGTGTAGNVQAGDAEDKPAGQGTEEPAAAAAGTNAGDQCNAKEPCDPFVRLALALGLNEREDFFKLLIWAFIAGFAERLVPDALDAIANRARRRRRREEDEETA